MSSEQKIMHLDVLEFIRRFLFHVLPKGFVRIRYYGLLANRTRAKKPSPLRSRCRVAGHDGHEFADQYEITPRTSGDGTSRRVS